MYTVSRGADRVVMGLYLRGAGPTRVYTPPANHLYDNVYLGLLPLKVDLQYGARN